VDFFDRMLVAYRDNDSRIRTVKLHIFEAMIEKGELNSDTIVFNNLISAKGEMEDRWEVPVKKSWHSRILTA
jgi:hypothetical protein